MTPTDLKRMSKESLDEWIQHRQAAARHAREIFEQAEADLRMGFRVLKERMGKPVREAVSA